VKSLLMMVVIIAFPYAAFADGKIRTDAVRNDGFTVCNFSEGHTSGYGTSIKYVLNRQSSLKLNVQRELLDDFDNKNDTSSTVFTISFGHTF